MALSDNLQRYFEAFDGKATWDTLKPLFDAAFHPDVQVVNADGTWTKDEWEEILKGLVAKGTKGDFQLDREEGDSFYYQVTLTMTDGTVMQPTAKGTVVDGQLIRVDPVDPEIYAKIAKESSG